MPYRKERFINGEVYHLVIRAIDDNIIFKDTDDHYRGIFSIYEFNDAKRVEIRERRSVRRKIKKEIKKITEEFEKIRAKHKTDGGPSSVSSAVADSRDKLVGVLTFCIMSNHLHLLVRQIKDNGIVKFMSKVGTGYGGYFNKKYQRKGHVFQNRFKAVHIKTDEQLKIVWAYIHANPVSLIEPKWKERGIRNLKKVIKFLENYKWSSYQDYMGKVNFPSVTEREFILELMGDKDKCREFLEDYLRYKGKIKEFPELTIE